MTDKDFDICIYHHNCADGMGAAMALYEIYGDKIKYHPGIHGTEPPNVKGKNVAIVDFSYKRDVLLEMAKDAEYILILDHHQSAEQDLVDLPENVEAIFDMSRSGAVMAWDYFHRGEVPQIIKLIGDRDIWKFEFKETKSVAEAIFSYVYEFDVWHDMLKNKKVSELVSEGEVLYRKKMKDVNEMANSDLKHELDILGYKVPAVNCSYFYSSELGHLLAKGAPFSACYQMTGDKVRFSLRSNDKGQDVAEVATIFGGGGHRNASGFSIPQKDWKEYLKKNPK